MHKRVMKARTETGGHNINAGAAIRGRKEKTIKNTSNLKCETVAIPIKPMKAAVWELGDKNNLQSVLPKVLKYFDFDEGVYMQSKLDGWRCTARLQTSSTGEVECALTTNNGKQYPWFEKLRKELIVFMSGDRSRYCMDGLDGELYTHRLLGRE